jgi:zinc protease
MGGMFTSRINMNLREDKHWTYGARSVIPDARGQRPLLLYASVERAKTAPAIQEILKEMNGLRGVKPITPLELSRAQQNLTLSLPGENETAAQVSASYEHLQIYHLPQDYYTRFVEDVQQLKVSDVRQEAHALLNPQQLTWVIIGDLSRIGAQVRSLNLGPVQVLDAEGRPVED